MPADKPRQTPPNDQAKALGRALKALRERAGLSQQQAAEEIKIKRQAWSMYEKGDRNSLLRVDLQERVTGALGLSREDLERERDRQAGLPQAAVEGHQTATIYHLPVGGRVKPGDQGPVLHGLAEPESVADFGWMFEPTVGTLRMVGDAMSGYVESGQLVIYDTARWPTRGEGCVVELKSGDVHVAEYLETAQGVLKVRQRAGDAILNFPMPEVKGVYLIRFRGA